MIEDLRGPNPERRRRAFRPVNAAGAALLLPLVLLGCSSAALPREDAPESGPDSAYRKIIADRLKESFTDIGGASGFEISDVRWVHTMNGWSWLSCVHFQDHDHRRTYAFFIRDNKIVGGRYAVETDGCGTLSYAPFDLMPNAARPAGGIELAPLH
jgi:hypothetical protein